jgi:hypothetical protein
MTIMRRSSLKVNSTLGAFAARNYKPAGLQPGSDIGFTHPRAAAIKGGGGRPHTLPRSFL